MKNLNLVLILIGAILISGCSEDNLVAPGMGDLVDSDAPALKSAKPAPQLIGSTYTPFSFDNPPIFWKGTVDFGDVGVYGLKFVSYDAPRDFSQASPFYEDFYIFDLADESIVYMVGWNAGVVTYANKDPEPVKVTANGKVTEAYGPLAGWEDRSIHIDGVVYWIDVGIPEACVGTMRIN